MITLEKNAPLSLTKVSPSLQTVQFGLGWDGMKRGLFGIKTRVEIDLDASALLFDAQGKLIDAVWFRQLRSKDGSVTHSGDNRTGDGDGDDETITVNLTRLPQAVKSVIFVVNAYSGESFKNVMNASCRVYNAEQKSAPLAEFSLTAAGGSHQGLIMARLRRSPEGWDVTGLGAPSQGRTYQDTLPDAVRHL